MRPWIAGFVISAVVAPFASAGGIAVYGETPKSVGNQPPEAASVSEKYDGRFELYQYPLVDSPVITQFTEPYTGKLEQPGNS